LLLAAITPAFFAATASAQTVHVPADYATIQAALNSGATMIYVGQGTYPETLMVQSIVTLLPEPPANPMSAVPFPVVAGMSISRNEAVERRLYVRGFHFTGRVVQQNSDQWAWTAIEGCKLDAGFQNTGGSGVGETIQIRGCVITGDVYLHAYGADFSGNMVWRGQARVHSNGLGAVIRDNLVVGPAAAGLLSTSGDSPGLMTGNTVIGVTTGYTLQYGTASGNVAEDCGGAGFALGQLVYGGRATFSNNLARRCGEGFGLFDRPGEVIVTGNQIDSSGAAGIHVGPGVAAFVTSNAIHASGSHGIWIEGYFPPSGNTVTFSGGDGIRSPECPEWNVVGRSSGHGIVAPAAKHNTVYLNAGDGLELSGTGGSSDSVSNNLSYGNAGFGLRWTGNTSPILHCNDWFGNGSGASAGTAAGATDLAMNPLFCNLPQDVVTLSSASPLLAMAGCGPIGALGPGCASALAVPPGAGPFARFAAHPNPSRGAVELRWERAAIPCRIEVFDLAGALRFRADLPAGTTELRWAGEDLEHRTLPRGVYFARRTAGAAHQLARLVLVR
jgi:hypothetical protein